MRLGGYIRVSRVGGREGDAFLSPTLQRERIEQWCLAHGHELVDVREDLDVSGGSTQREQLIELVEAIEAGRLEGLVVATLDRFGRSLPYAIALIDRIDKAGGQFVSVADGFDTRTPYGELALNVMLSVAQFELKRITAQWRTIVERQIKEGRHPGAMPPFGYQRGPDGRLIPNPAGAPVVKEMFKLYASGDSLSELSRLFNKRGVRTQLGALPTRRFIHTILTNRVYLGEARSGKLVRHDAHPALVDEALFARCQHFQMKPPRGPEPALLRGLVRCQGCRYAMAPVMRDGKRRYRCLGNQQGRQCPAPAFVTEEELLPLVEEAFFALAGSYVGEAFGDQTNVDDLRGERDAAWDDFVWFRDSIDMQRALGRRGYVEGLEVRRVAFDNAEKALSKALQARPVDMPDLAMLRTSWPGIDGVEKNGFFRDVLDVVVVRKHPSRSRRLPIRQRVRFLASGTVDDVGGIPRGGRKPAGSIVAFEWADNPSRPWILPGQPPLEPSGDAGATSV